MECVLSREILFIDADNSEIADLEARRLNRIDAVRQNWRSASDCLYVTRGRFFPGAEMSEDFISLNLIEIRRFAWRIHFFYRLLIVRRHVFVLAVDTRKHVRKDISGWYNDVPFSIF